MRSEYDFSKAKRAKEIPHLRKLQDEAEGKSCVTLMLDDEILSRYRDRASEQGIGWRALICQTLIEAIAGRDPQQQGMV